MEFDPPEKLPLKLISVMATSNVFKTVIKGLPSNKLIYRRSTELNFTFDPDTK